MSGPQPLAIDLRDVLAARRDDVRGYVLEAQINGSAEPVEAVVDTGAYRSLINGALAARLGLTPSQVIEVTGVVGAGLRPTYAGITCDLHGAGGTRRIARFVEMLSHDNNYGVILGRDFLDTFTHLLTANIDGHHLMLMVVVPP